MDKTRASQIAQDILKQPFGRRTYGAFLHDELETINAIAEAARAHGRETREENSIVAYEKYIKALEAIAKGTIGEKEKAVLRHSPKILQDIYTRQDEMLGILKFMETSAPNPPDQDPPPASLRSVETEKMLQREHRQRLQQISDAAKMRGPLNKLHRDLAGALGVTPDKGRGR